jgi:hypothetical protein
MASGDIKIAYGTAADATITLASLATDSTKLTGRESTAIDNTATLALDYLVSGKITTGTSPTTAKTIEVWCVGSRDGTSWPDVFDGTDSAETVTSADVKASVCRLVASMTTDATSNRTYHFGPVSVASLFGGIVPPKFVFFATHDTAVNLNATAGNHQVRVQPVYETITP